MSDFDEKLKKLRGLLSELVFPDILESIDEIIKDKDGEREQREKERRRKKVVGLMNKAVSM